MSGRHRAGGQCGPGELTECKPGRQLCSRGTPSAWSGRQHRPRFQLDTRRDPRTLPEDAHSRGSSEKSQVWLRERGREGEVGQQDSQRAVGRAGGPDGGRRPCPVLHGLQESRLLRYKELRCFQILIFNPLDPPRATFSPPGPQHLQVAPLPVEPHLPHHSPLGRRATLPPKLCPRGRATLPLPLTGLDVNVNPQPQAP